GGLVDAVLTRCVDTAFAVPELLVALGVLAAVGRGPLAVALAIGLASVPGYARLLRGAALVVVRADYVLASRALGAGGWWVARRDVLPAVRGVAAVAGTAGFGAAVLLAGGLGFLGLGAPPPAPEWGAMLAAAVPDLRDAWWAAAAPGAAIALVVGAVSVLGDAADPGRTRTPGRVRPVLPRTARS
ncbi:MAG: ABC transporter permease subunit, partial [Pseudonocardia sp.]|nr:ABC transporter permease subunit [Pseudonocardia sp.]